MLEMGENVPVQYVNQSEVKTTCDTYRV